MPFLLKARSFLRNIFLARRVESDLDEEVRSHLDMLTEENIEGGMSPQEARRAARIELGGVDQLKEQVHQVQAGNWLYSILGDCRYSLRQFRKNPGFTAIIVLTLAFGIGANSAIFSVVNRVLLRPLPYPESDRLVALRLDAPGAGGLASFSNGLQLSPSMYITFSDHNQSFESMGIWSPGRANVTGIAQPEEVRTELISDGILQTLGVPPLLGRWFSEADQDPRGGKTVVLSYGYWKRRFGGDPQVVGRTFQLDAIPREIVGVMPAGFRMVDQDFDVLIPMAVDRLRQKLAPFGYSGIARLKPNASLAQADADVARLISVWMDSWSNGPGTNPHYYEIWRITPNFCSLKEQVIGNISSVLWVVMSTVGIVLLIACTNIANLLLVRAESRQQELSIRAALGAGRGRIARQLLVESVVVSLAGGALAVGVAYGSLQLLAAVGPADLPRLSEISLDARTVAFTFLLSVFSGLFFGSIPVWKYARVAGSMTMGGAQRTATTTRGHQRSRHFLVIAQVAMALVLLVSSALMIRTFAALRKVEPGFSEPWNVQTMRISIPDTLISNPVLVTRTQNSIADQIAAIPGVTAVAFASALPMEGADPNWDELGVEGKTYDGGEPPLRMFNYVSPGFFHAMGTRLVAGRDFTWSDLYDLRPMVMVSESFARENWGSAAAAVGKRVRQFTNMPWQAVIGVVEDVRVHGADKNAPPIIYWPAMLNDPYTAKPTIDAPNSVTFAIRTPRAAEQAFISELQRAVWSVNSDLPLASIRTMQDIYGQSMARISFTLVMLAIAGSMGLALSIIGIYGVISYAVSRRTREIGIRLALGAQKRELRWMFVRSALAMAGFGIGVGLIAASAVVQLMKSLLFGVSPLDPWTFIGVPLVLTAAAAVASHLPARRASRLDPIVALRYE
ncbi:MAG TPA: ABC transporter permease [Candidatus Sulfotelmatobacter sp.]|nr:ABC transporter permease [Candidatus Sulfotelmatobacter sp.]